MILDNIFAKLRFSDFNITNIEPYQMEFKSGNVVDYSKYGRRKSLLHFVTAGKRLYETEDNIFSVGAGTLIFIPDGTKYLTRAKTVNNESCSGIGISFDLDIAFNQNELNIYYEENINRKELVFDLFVRTYQIYKSSPLELLQLKNAVYSLLSFLNSSNAVNIGEFSQIEPAIEYINAHFKENLPVKLYAEKCNLSESYFRKKFTEYTGLSPIEYRNQLRFVEAKRLYQIGFSTQQIAEKLGFCDGSYLLKLYKRNTGRTLKNDAKTV